MNKVQLAEHLAEKAGSTKKEALAWVELVFTSIEKALVKGEPVKLSGFGNFTVKNRPARIAKNPVTRKEVKVPASRKVSFKASELLKEKL
jgi:nucleoid DNA-binding protein